MPLRGQHIAAVLANVMASQAVIFMGLAAATAASNLWRSKMHIMTPSAVSSCCPSSATLNRSGDTLETNVVVRCRGRLSCFYNLYEGPHSPASPSPFKTERAAFIFGTLYRSGIRTRGRVPFLSSLNLLGLELLYCCR